MIHSSITKRSGPGLSEFSPEYPTNDPTTAPFTIKTKNMKIKYLFPAIALIALSSLQTSCKKSNTGSGGTAHDTTSSTGVVVSTYAGLGISLTGGPAPRVALNDPTGVCTGQDLSVYVADYGHAVVQKASITGSLNVFAGNGGQFCLDGTGEGAGLPKPEGIFAEPDGYFWVADNGCGIRRIDVAGGVTTFFQNDLSNQYQIYPAFLCLDSHKNIYVISLDNGQDPTVYMIDPQAKLTRYVGSGQFGHDDGSGAAASFIYIKGICVDGSDNLYVVDGSLIRKITAGSVTTIAGSQNSGYADGQGTSAQFAGLGGICVDASNNIFVTDGNRIREIDHTGKVTTIAGTADFGYVDGDGSAAQFNVPRGICTDNNGNLYVADFGNNLIRKIKLKQ